MLQLLNAIAWLGGAVRYVFAKLFIALFTVIKAPFVLLLRAVFGVRDFARSSFRRVVGDEQFFTGRVVRAVKGISYAFRKNPRSVPGVMRYYAGRSVARYGGLARYILLLSAPLAAGLLLLLTLLHFSALTPALELKVGEERIGVVATESDYLTARAMAAGVLSLDPSADPKQLLGEVTLTPALVKNSAFTSQARLCERLLARSGARLRQACGVYVDGRLIGVLSDEAEARRVFNEYLDELSAGEEGVSAFNEDIRFTQGLYPENGVDYLSAQALSAMLREKTEAAVYTVESEASLAELAAQTGVSAETLLALNPALSETAAVPAGTKVATAPAKALLSVRTVRAEITQQAKPFETVNINSDALYIGTTRTVVKGVDGTEQITDLVTYVNGEAVSREEISRLTLQEPIAQTVQVGTRALDSEYVITKSFGGILLWPVPDADRINSDYAYRWGKLHAAIDIGSSRGTSLGKTVVAAAKGVVVIAGVHSSYGYYVKIDHGGGLQTLYAHCTAGSLMVYPGQQVNAGQPIALVGQTGYATGPHLHFEVIINGVRVDPKPYLGISR